MILLRRRAGHFAALLAKSVPNMPNLACRWFLGKTEKSAWFASDTDFSATSRINHSSVRLENNTCVRIRNVKTRKAVVAGIIGAANHPG